MCNLFRSAPESGHAVAQARSSVCANSRNCSTLERLQVFAEGAEQSSAGVSRRAASIVVECLLLFGQEVDEEHGDVQLEYSVVLKTRRCQPGIHVVCRTAECFQC